MNTTTKLLLRGHFAGKTVVLGGRQFTNGECILTENAKEQSGIIKYLNRCYQAYPEGNEGYDGSAPPKLDINLVLQGAYAGKTLRLREWDFVDGVLHLHDLPENLEGIITYLGRCYQAYPEDEINGKAPAPVEQEPELPKASSPDMAEIAAALRKEARDGERDVHEEDIEDADQEVRSEVPADGGTAQEEAGASEGSTEAEAGGAGVQANGDGGSSRLAQVISDLDPSNEKHWTKSGDPSVFAVRTLMGDDSITKAHLADVWDFESHAKKE